MDPIINLIAEEADRNTRLDVFLAAYIENWSRSQIQRLIDDGDVLVNQRPVRSSYKLKPGDEVDAELTEAETARFEPENIPLDIVYEDEFLAVINKPAGMIVHPGAGVPSGTLANAIAWHFGLKGETTENGHRVGIVHRLDKDTSGLILVAKDERTQDELAGQFRKREVFKSYIALVHGSPELKAGRIDRPIARDRWHRTKMTVAANGREATSLWKVRQRFEKFALVQVEIQTGRTHQIRVHMASINHPVVGDPTYNEGRDNTIANGDIKKVVERLGRVFLHAEKLSFTHPKSGERLSFTCEMPLELTELLKFL